MSYGHAERNLALIRQLEAETKQLLGELDQLDKEQPALPQEIDGGHAHKPPPEFVTPVGELRP